MKKVLTILTLMLICSYQAGMSQSRYHRKMKKPASDFYIGPEFLAGTHTSLFLSDIDELNELRVAQTGISFGGMAGHRLLKARVRKSQFSSESYVREKIRTSVVEGTLNFYPLQVTSRKFRSFEPYAVFGISRSRYNMYGNYVNPIPPPAAAMPKQCVCECPCCNVALQRDCRPIQTV